MDNNLHVLDVHAYDHAPRDRGHGSAIRWCYHENENGDHENHANHANGHGYDHGGAHDHADHGNDRGYGHENGRDQTQLRLK